MPIFPNRHSAEKKHGTEKKWAEPKPQHQVFYDTYIQIKGQKGGRNGPGPKQLQPDFKFNIKISFWQKGKKKNPYSVKQRSWEREKGEKLTTQLLLCCSCSFLCCVLFCPWCAFCFFSLFLTIFLFVQCHGGRGAWLLLKAPFFLSFFVNLFFFYFFGISVFLLDHKRTHHKNHRFNCS